MRKKSIMHGSWYPWYRLQAKGFLCLLMILALGSLSPIAAAAEQSKSGRMTDMQFADYEDLYYSILDLTAGPENEVQFESLPQPAQAMYIAAMLDMEVQCGGLCQFFVNGGSAYAVRASDSLQMIGLEPIKILYESFLSDHQIDPSDLDTFHIDKAEDFIAQYERFPFADFDNAYMELWEELDFNKVMLQYANDHADVFSHE